MVEHTPGINRYVMNDVDQRSRSTEVKTSKSFFFANNSVRKYREESP